PLLPDQALGFFPERDFVEAVILENRPLLHVVGAERAVEVVDDRDDVLFRKFFGHGEPTARPPSRLIQSMNWRAASCAIRSHSSAAARRSFAFSPAIVCRSSRL